MNLKTFVKVGNISNLSDARYCAGFGVNMLGFNLDPTQENVVALETAKEIMGWVAGVDFVLEFGSLPLEQIKGILNETDTGAAQVNSLETAEGLAGSTAQILLQLSVDSESQLSQLQEATQSDKLDLIVIQSNTPELFEKIETIVKGSQVKALKGYDVSANNVLNEGDSFAGIALSGSEEEKPGFKDYDELADIFEVLEVLD
ncbi:hypothetical protein [Reichenbachiella ulvae]|uniref:Phosphoribosylanthranilate isomerase n=1 Tax=Reichenbachiella ulvae TaxID=2980104 RepID=A0ABT3CR24_9BACT|nr:hypothetical protein [Reichenbachiella ulvae]MCV9386099.1 hypothetical protein [Reichenbachiella ulvae]